MEKAPLNKVLVTRPWGNFVQYTQNASSTVKVITVEKGQELSLQYHHHRSEFWRILEGHPRVTIGKEGENASESGAEVEVVDAKPGDEFIVSIENPHRIGAPTDRVVFLEIAFGQFDEDDIVRTEDKYGRV